MRFAILVFLCCLLGNAPARAASAPPTAPGLPQAIELFNARRYPEARALLEQIVTAEPKNAAAHHYLGRCLATAKDSAALEQALASLARAVELEPDNAVYLGIFGGHSLDYADRTRSVSAVTKGRDAMEKALSIDPDYTDAREGLFQFYSRAPWPLGSSAKAATQLAEIRKRNPDLASVLEVPRLTAARDFATAFAVCDAVLTRNGNHYTALYQFGRTASVSGEQLDRGLSCLQKALTLQPPTPASPSHSNVWQRIGNIREQLQQPDQARAAYRTALELDPGNRQATEALAKLQ